MYRPFYWDFDYDRKPEWGNRDYSIIRNHEQFDELLTKWNQAPTDNLALDSETSSLDHTDCELAGYCVSFSWDEGYYIPFGHYAGKNAPESLRERFYEELLYKVPGEVIMYNARFDLRILEAFGADIDKFDFFDLEVLVYNMDSECNNKGLEDLKEYVLDWPITDTDPTAIIYRKPESDLDYTAGDAHATWALNEMFKPFRERLETPVTIDNKLIRPLKLTEETPKHIDVEWFRKIKEEAEKEKQAIVNKVHKAFSQEFNVSSDEQLRGVLKSHDLDTGEYTDKGNMKTGEDPLKNIRDEHKGIEYILEHRAIDKHINSFINPFIDEADIEMHNKGMDSLFSQQESDDKKQMYFSYRNTQTGSGRLSAGADRDNPYFGDLNVQQLPKIEEKQKYNLVDGDDFLGYSIEEDDGEDYDFKAPSTHLSIRHGIKPQPGCLWGSYDFSGQEVRVLANVTGEDVIIEEMLHGDGDFYLLVRDKVLDKFGDYSRGVAKVFVLSTLYGAGGWNIKNQLELESADEGDEVLNELWDLCPKVKEWRDRKIQNAKENGYIKNYFGRVRWVTKNIQKAKQVADEDDKPMEHTGYWSLVERQAGNTPIQGAAAEQAKIATRHVYDNIIKQTGGIDFEIQVHDELNFSIKDDRDYVKKWVPRIKDEMEVEVEGWPVPIPVDVEIGPSFGLMCEVDVYDDKIIELPNDDVIA